MFASWVFLLGGAMPKITRRTTDVVNLGLLWLSEAEESGDSWGGAGGGKECQDGRRKLGDFRG